MNKFNSTKLQTRLDTIQPSWMVQVYGGDRRLLWVLDPSHAWTFFGGLGVGLLLAVGWFNLAQSSPSTAHPLPPSIPAEMWVD
jgi:hypothetical protein